METLEITKQIEISALANKVNTGLAVFEKRKEELTVLAEKAHGLKITSLDDNSMIKSVSATRKELKAARIEIEKEGKSMRDPLTAISKHIKAKEDELVAIIEPTEKELLQEEKWLEAEKEKIRMAAEDAEKARIQNRIDRLSAFGFAIEYSVITTIDDVTFDMVLQNAKAEHLKDVAAKEDEKRLQKIAEDKLEADSKELEELRKQQAEAQKIIDESNARIQKDQAEKEAAIELERKKIDAERQAQEAERQRIIEMEQVAEQARLKWIEDAKKEVEKKQQDEIAAQKEIERQAALRPDKEKLQSFSDSLSNLKTPIVNNENAQNVVNEIQIMINKMQAHIIKKIKEL